MGVTSNIVAPVLVGKALFVARQLCKMPPRVNADYAAKLKSYGRSIDIPITSTVAGRDIIPGSVPPSTAEQAPTVANLILDQLYEAPSTLTTQDLSAIDTDSMFVPRVIEECVKTVANRIDTTLLLSYQDFYNCDRYATAGTGVIATDPFTTSLAELQAAKRILVGKGLVGEEQMCSAVMSPVPYSNLIGIPAIQAQYASGSTAALQTGLIPYPVIGFDCQQSQNVLFHTAGTLATATNRAPTVTANVAAGATTIGFSSGTLTGTVVQGDIFTIAGVLSTDGSLQHFVVTNTVTAAGNAMAGITFQPPLPSAVSATTAVLVYASHRANLAFHRDAIGYATRYFKKGSGLLDQEGAGGTFMQMMDPQTGLILGICARDEYFQETFSIFAFWGRKTVRSAFGMRILGAT